MTCQSSPPPPLPTAGGPFEPPGRLEAVEPLSDSLVRAVRLPEEEPLELAAFDGVLNRFSAFASVAPPACAEAAAPPDAPEAPDEAAADDGAAAVEIAEDDEELPPEARKVGALEIAEVPARELDGSDEFGP